MPRHWIARCVAVAAGLAMADVARAAPPAVVFNVGAASDYEFRGISQTNNKANVFVGGDIALEGLGYAGVWLSNVDFQDAGKAVRIEYDLYAGVRPVVGPVTVDLSVIRYGYTRQSDGSRQDFTEWKIAPSMAAGPATLGVAYAYSDRSFAGTGPANYYEINGWTPIGKTAFSVSGALGRQEVVGPLDYTTWNLGLGYALNSHIGFDLRYWDTDQHGFGNIYKSKIVLGVKATFP